MLNQEQIGAYIAARRKTVGLTQAELGERLGITAQSVSNWERGETMPDTGLLQDLALILDTSAGKTAAGFPAARNKESPLRGVCSKNPPFCLRMR